MLIDCELERFFEKRFCLGATAELQEQFSEENSRHHPIALFADAKRVVGYCLGTLAGVDQRLREAEAEHFVVRLPLDERAKLLHAGGHGYY